MEAYIFMRQAGSGGYVIMERMYFQLAERYRLIACLLRTGERSTIKAALACDCEKFL